MFAFRVYAVVVFTAQASTRDYTAGGRFCGGERWASLYSALAEASERQEFWYEVFSPAVMQITEDSTKFDWFKVNYQDCVEGLLSLVLYLSLHLEERSSQLLDLASRTARELNPLALTSGLSSWPLFGLLDQLQLVWQGGQHAAPLLTEPWLLGPSQCRSQPLPELIHPLLPHLSEAEPPSQGLSAAWAWEEGDEVLSTRSPLRLVRSIPAGGILIDAGVFDGTDWSMIGILSGATVIGFEPLAENRRLIGERLPAALEREQVPPHLAGKSHTLLNIVPGEPMPRVAWHEAFKGRCQDGRCSSADNAHAKPLGHSYIMGAALGERVRSLNMTTRYDYSSIADQGYLKGPQHMEIEAVAMTTLDVILGDYLDLSGFDSIDVLKLDVEGYEMGALRGAERLLSLSRVHFLVLEFHPGMLGSSGTDPQGMLEFLHHYCFRCHSLKIDRAYSFAEFVGRYTSSAALPLQGLGELEDLVCESMSWRSSS